jgi:hypothetical protein
MATLRAAYDLLTRKGNDTSRDGEWDPVLDRAHHGLGLVLGLHAADEVRQARLAAAHMTADPEPPSSPGSAI